MGGFYCVVRAIFVSIIKILFNIHVINQSNEDKIPNGGIIVCANHYSGLDPLTVCCALRKRQPHFMAKKELFKIPVFSQFLRSIGAYPVDRGGNDVGAIKHTIVLLNKGKCVAMFPQGTRYSNVNPKETPIKQGVGLIAARTDANILPIHIKTKDYKVKLFRRTDVIIGEVIKFEELNYNKDEAYEYNRISSYVFDRICELENENAK